MMRKCTTFWVLLLCVVIMLQGCNRQVPQGNLGSEVWETLPEVSFGVLESETLSVLPWNSGRTETTSHFAVAETENGYYYSNSLQGLLFFADKEALDTWIPVCNKPDCSHQPGDRSCSAAITSNEIVVRDGRIYFTESLSRYSHLHSETGETKAIMSMLPDGSDFRVEFYPEEALLYNGGSVSDVLTGNYWLLMSTETDEKGNSTLRLFRTDKDGCQKLAEVTRGADEPASVLGSAFRSMGVNGTELHAPGILAERGYYSFYGDTPEPVKLPDVPLSGAYLAGNTLRYFRQNEGYYDIRLDTGEEVFLTENRLNNSVSAILLPNLILESTLLSSLSVKTRMPGMEHFMEIFDGQQWHSVELPEDLHYASMGTFFYLFAVTSDALWLTHLETVTERENGLLQQYWDSHLYRIGLGGEEWKLEYIGTIKQPRPTSS